MAKKINSRDYINPHNNPGISLAEDNLDTTTIVQPRTGLYNTNLGRTNFTYNKPDGASMLENEGAYIVMGQVPIGQTETSGYGALGMPAESIDLVVGRGAALNRGRGPAEGDIVNNNHMSDAARIYICRLSYIDEEFNIESDEKTVTTRYPGSAIALKADNVRIVGREGVKIVTGKVFSPNGSGGEETNSLNGRIQTAPRIDLVAGNNYENVQGVALGERTAEALREMNQIVGQIWSAVFNLALIQSGFNGVIGVNPVPWIASAAPPANLGIYTKVLNSLYQTRTSATMWELNYVTEKPLPGKRYIVSTNVRTN